MRDSDLHFPPFTPKRMIAGPHAQTIASVCYPAKIPPHSTREHLVRLDDGDSLVVHENVLPDKPSGLLMPSCVNASGAQRVIVLVHGLGGSHRSQHVARVASKLARHGWTCLRIDQRGCGSGLKLAKRPTHAGRSDDLAEVVRFIEKRWPGQPITLIGFSLGGNLVLKLLAEYGAQPPAQLDSAVAVAPSIDLAYCAANLSQGRNWFYQRVFLRTLNRIVRERRRLVPECADVELALKPTTIVDFDNVYTAPLAGYRDAQDYYAQCSASRRLESIHVKTWIITSRDDPLVPFQMFADLQASNFVSLATTERGGHLGFIGNGTHELDPFWLDWRLLEIVAALPKSK